jgi:tetratricopeptide (TPR) repeat protein
LDEDTGNSAYLNLLVEQGWLGITSYMIVLVISLILAIQRYRRVTTEYKRYIVAGIFGLVFVLLQGLVHATLVATRAIPALLVPAGLALVSIQENPVESSPVDLSGSRVERSLFLKFGNIWVFAFCLVVSAFLLALLFWFRSSIVSTFDANLGAVYMARIELADFPAGEWDDGSQVDILAPAKKKFMRALQLNSENSTANYRLGLMALQEGDFKSAVTYLREANRKSPEHRGIRKALGYALTWMGENQQAVWLLSDIPEAMDELDAYTWWWDVHGQPDLAQRAKDMHAAISIVENQ